jgi:hypothetical protein
VPWRPPAAGYYLPLSELGTRRYPAFRRFRPGAHMGSCLWTMNHERAHKEVNR